MTDKPIDPLNKLEEQMKAVFEEKPNPTGDKDKKVYTIKSEKQFDDFLEKYNDKVFCDLKSVEDWQFVDKNNEDFNSFWREKHNKQFPSGTFIRINIYGNKSDVIDYLKEKITNIETFYLS
jgi:hypothetical protein